VTLVFVVISTAFRSPRKRRQRPSDGTVSDKGVPFERKVDLEDVDTKATNSVTTGSDGLYLSFVRPGNYSIRFQARAPAVMW